MQTSVNLQEPFSYSIFYIIVILILVVLITIYLFKKKEKKIIEIKKVSQENKQTIKQKYISKLVELDNKLDKDEISVRQAYQQLSSIIRYFVYEMTNIKVQNYTLEEIKDINIPILYELIEEYYAPEFSKKCLGDIKVSIEKTRKVIEKWN